MTPLAGRPALSLCDAVTSALFLFFQKDMKTSFTIADDSFLCAADIS